MQASEVLRMASLMCTARLCSLFRGEAAREIALSSLKREFGLGETLATTLMGLATQTATKITAYTYAFMVNWMLGRP
jgi:hypothetical protein